MPNSPEQKDVGRRGRPRATTGEVHEPPAETAAENEPSGVTAPVDTVATLERDVVPRDGASIVSIIKGLEGQVDTAFKLKKVVEAELKAARKKLSEESAVRAELEARVESLEPLAALVGRLREDMAFTEQERDKLVKSLAETQHQLEEMTEKCETLAEEVTSAGARAEQLEGERMTLEAEVLNLRDKVEDHDRLRRELADATGIRRDLEEHARDLSSRLDAAETSKSDLEGDLAAARESAQGLREQVDESRRSLASTDSEVTDLRLQLDKLQAANADLIETKSRLESELRAAKADYATTKNELDKVKSTLSDVYGELTNTSKRVRQRYLKEKEGDPEGAKTALSDVATELTLAAARVRRKHLAAPDGE